MPKICYQSFNFRPETLAKIVQANRIITEYQAQGYELTLRQLYYQFVARGFIANKDREYKNLGSIINDARLAGLIDWDAIVDRTRNLRALAHWNSPVDIISSARYGYRTNHWKGQNEYVEVWVEKDALVGVIERACNRLDVPFFSCRGYTSQSEIWSAGRRLRSQYGRDITIIHLGDHDPSGLDMTRDVGERLAMFAEKEINIQRIALNWDQIQTYQPPPNPAKLGDSRATKYIEEYGDESWELDALDPAVLDELITGTIKQHLDEDLFQEQVESDNEERKSLKLVEDHWDSIVLDARDRWESDLYQDDEEDDEEDD